MDATLAVIGASGDMARRLLFPALYELDHDARLGDLRIIANARRDWDRDEWLRRIRHGIAELAGIDIVDHVWQRFVARFDFLRGELSQEDLRPLVEKATGNAAFYLALPPQAFAEASEALAGLGLNDESNGWRRLVVEKPFGVDLESAVELNQRLHRDWDESQLFRIDHFLGKETVQNILVFRFANRFLDPIMNCNHVESIQITAAETLGLEGRAGFYEEVGALRDMLQSHLMQLMALIAMEPLARWDNDALHDHKVDALRSVRPITADDVQGVAVRGQYVGGQMNGRRVPGYREEEGVNAESQVETFAALKLHIDSWRWAGTPIYLRSGKRLQSDLTEVAINFREPPFKTLSASDRYDNRLVFLLRPHESINLAVETRRPGLELRTQELVMHADYPESGTSPSASYRQLLMDLFEGERTAFLRFDEVEWSWRIVEPVLQAWQSGVPDRYAAGSEGPESQRRLLEPGHAWRPLEVDTSELYDH
jgi:glucose-6-phosphate 1-dehydrogenase